MTESTARAARFELQSSTFPSYTWAVPQKPVCVRIPFPIIDRLEHEAVESFRSLSSRGSEIGGLLFGNVTPGNPAEVSIEDYELISCDYSRGPLYRVGDDDMARFDRSILQHGTPGSLGVVGLFRSHTRKGISLDADDIAFFDSRFRDPHHLVLLIRPFATKTSTAGIFIREGGSVQGETSYLEFPFRSSLLSSEKPVVEPVESKPSAPAASSTPAPATPRTMVRGQIVPIASRREMSPSTPAMAVEPAKPAVETAKPAVETAKPAVETAKPAVETAKPAVETAKPAVETARLVVEPSKPAVEPAEPELPSYSARTSSAPPVSAPAQPAPRVEAKVATPKPEEKVVKPQSDAKVAAPKPEEKIVKPQSDAKVAAPKPEERIVKPQSDAKTATPKPEDKYSKPQVDAKTAAPKPEEKIVKPQSDAKTSTPKPEDKTVRPQVEARAATPKPEAPKPQVEAKAAPAKVTAPSAAVASAAATDAVAGQPAGGRSKMLWIGLGGAVLVVLLIVFLAYPPLLHRNRPSAGPSQDSSALSLRVERTAGEILLTWNRDSDVIRTATHAVLSISDGDQHENVEMDLAQLRNGSISYSPASSDVVFKMEVTGKGEEKTASESVRVLRTRPSPLAGTESVPQPGQTPAKPTPAVNTPANTTPNPPASTPNAASTPAVNNTPAVAVAQTPAQAEPPEKAPERTLKPFQAPSLSARLHPVNPADLPDAPTVGRTDSNSGVASAVTGLNMNSMTAPVAPAKPSVAPPPSAQPAEKKAVATGGQLVQAVLVSKKDPEYPKLARETGAKGIVELVATIGTDGKVKSVKVVHGPPMLIKAASDAVLQWKYKPTMLNGVAVEAQTQVFVNFMGGDR
jgi:TonB family protein